MLLTDVKDSLGHDTGDLLLRQVDERLRARLHAGNTVARLGGDEFAVLLPGLSDAGAATAIARELRAVLERPFMLDDIEHVHADVSVGIAVYAQPWWRPGCAHPGRRRRHVPGPTAAGSGVAEYDVESDRAPPLSSGTCRFSTAAPPAGRPSSPSRGAGRAAARAWQGGGGAKKPTRTGPCGWVRANRSDRLDAPLHRPQAGTGERRTPNAQSLTSHSAVRHLRVTGGGTH